MPNWTSWVTTAMGGLRTGLAQVYHWSFYEPLQTFYLHGPTFLGMWAGRPYVDICATLTNTDSNVWRQNPAACETEVHRHVHAFVVMAQTALLIVGYVTLARGAFFLVKIQIYLHMKRRMLRMQQEHQRIIYTDHRHLNHTRAVLAPPPPPPSSSSSGHTADYTFARSRDGQSPISLRSPAEWTPAF